MNKYLIFGILGIIAISLSGCVNTGTTATPSATTTVSPAIKNATPTPTEATPTPSATVTKLKKAKLEISGYNIVWLDAQAKGSIDSVNFSIENTGNKAIEQPKFYIKINDPDGKKIYENENAVTNIISWAPIEAGKKIEAQVIVRMDVDKAGEYRYYMEAFDAYDNTTLGEVNGANIIGAK